MSRSVWCGCITLILVLTSVSGAYAQSTASISGVVRDSAGGVVPGATVVVKEDATGRAYEVVTDADGRYQVSALQAGFYTVTVSLAGFKTAEANGIRVAPASR